MPECEWPNCSRGAVGSEEHRDFCREHLEEAETYAPEEEVPACTHPAGHAWVAGKASKTPSGIRIETRMCRRCGYQEEVDHD